MENRRFKIHNLIAVICAVVISCAVFLCFVTSSSAYAANYENGQVIQELSRDSSFRKSDYPDDGTDYSLKVIQIGESASKELFVYVYQPSHNTIDLKGSKISISYGYSVNGSGLNPQVYNLKLVSSSGVFDKYLVKDYPFPADGDRYYNIVEIFRKANEAIDDLGNEHSPVTDIAYSVGQQWYVHDINDTKSYSMGTFNVLSVEAVFSGCVRLSSVLFWNWPWDNTPDATDVWFYAFTQDEYVIDHIVDATLTYSSQYVNAIEGLRDMGNRPLEDIVENQTAKISENDEVSFTSKGLFGGSYNWKRIMRASKFVSTLKEQHANLISEVEDTLKSAEWVFCFLDTRVDYYTSGDFGLENSYIVSDVGLLQLHFFDLRGKEYDLGVVSSLVDPDDSISGGTMEYLRQSWEYFWERFIMVVGLIVGLILLVLLLNFIGPVKALLKFIFKGIKFVITAPFKLLKSIFKKGG